MVANFFGFNNVIVALDYQTTVDQANANNRDYVGRVQRKNDNLSDFAVKQDGARLNALLGVVLLALGILAVSTNSIAGISIGALLILLGLTSLRECHRLSYAASEAYRAYFRIIPTVAGG